MITTTIDNVPGYRIVKVLGMVYGSAIQTKHFGKDFKAGLRTLVGGEPKGYREMIDESRKMAIDRMVVEGNGMGANAIIGVRLATTQTMETAAELLAFGTAVKIRPNGYSHS